MLKAIEITTENLPLVQEVVSDPDAQLEPHFNYVKFFEGEDAKVYVVVYSDKSFSVIKGEDFPRMFRKLIEPIAGEDKEFFDIEVI